ncbi:hypothetical protein [Bacillus canaveralius]|uniref:hypothetical protein n=1 Tax=Bacillus canaveralius TaxID=1403243 RepID=UPI0015E0E2F1|nr:hypothetical protein [Bacillus canaveralius]
MRRDDRKIALKKKISVEELFKIGEAVEIKAVFPSKNGEEVGTIVYKRKAVYRGLEEE